MTVDQKIITDQIYENRAKRGEHRNLGGTQIPESACISLCKSYRDKAYQEDIHVADTDSQCLGCICRITFAKQEKVD